MGFDCWTSKVVSMFVFGFLVLNCSIGFGSYAQLLPEDEVNVLRDIAKTIGKRDWNFSVDPCEGEYGWSTPNPVKGFENAVTCNCSFSNGTLCHVISIVVKAQSLIGTLPPQLGGLPYLQELDLTRNYLNGTIPPEWGSTNLVNISLVGNRLTGPIPKELANITTLKSLVLDYNQLSGALPPELGNLPQIERMLFSSNNFTGELPPTFAKLTTMTDFRISDNHLTGKIPNFIRNWTNIKKIVFQASGLNGPIPLAIARLRKLTDLRISDINGTEATFPPLDNMIKLTTLILRSCNIVGQLPEYLGEMKSLKNLDLSFNKLSGKIPSSYSNLKNVDNIFLTGNLLSGTVPDWMLKEGDNIDLSYNNFTTVNSATSSCQQRNTNMFASSSKRTSSEIVSCSYPCPRYGYSLYVNCGGSEVTVNGTTKYDSDTDMVGSSTFSQGTRNSAENWVLSNTGYFLDHENDKDSYITTNVSRLSMVNPELYVNARISPLSLTYYGYCLGNGNYILNLHFAEIMFTNDTTYRSLGRRIFNVYLQGKLVMKDFNIADEAGGVGKAVIKTFTAVVTSNTLEIRFYWAGKGTTGIPIRGVYGPLISAISVHSDFTPPESGNNISVAVVVAVVIGSLLVILLVIVILWWKCCLKKKNTLEQELKGLDLKTGKFTLRQIKAATNNFDINNKIGEGGFGPVYKGCLSDGTIIAVKQLSSKSKQGNREFLNEIGMISALQHPHLVKLYGCCIEGDQLLLIYEYLENNSVARALFGQKDSQLKLDWPTRHKICVGIARGLAYLHEESRLKIVHRDIKATNVLLDKDLNPKISDFGLAKLDEEEFTHISTRIAGTVGYMAPEYATRGYLTDKADVYSFGIVLLEIVSGRSNSSRPKDDHFNLLDWALFLKEKENLMALVDSKLGSDFNKEEMLITINLALLCTNISPANRPIMSSVVSMLEGRRVLDEFVLSDSLVSIADMKVMRDHYQSIEEGTITDTQTHSISIGGPSVASSSSVPDLYPIINPDSDYWKNRD